MIWMLNWTKNSNFITLKWNCYSEGFKNCAKECQPETWFFYHFIMCIKILNWNDSHLCTTTLQWTLAQRFWVLHKKSKNCEKLQFYQNISKFFSRFPKAYKCFWHCFRWPKVSLNQQQLAFLRFQILLNDPKLPQMHDSAALCSDCNQNFSHLFLSRLRNYSLYIH